MKRIITILATLLLNLVAFAQSTNPLNYSGKLYLKSIEAISTTRYVSYDDHAILTTEMMVPTVKVTPIIFDFEAGTITYGDTVFNIKVNSTKVYQGVLRVVVISCNEKDGTDRFDVVYPEGSNPYFLHIQKRDSSYAIEKFNLSTKPVVTSPDDALRQLMGM